MSPMLCSVCTHRSQRRIDEALVSGEPVRSVARRFGLSEPAVRRHKHNHLPEKLAAAYQAEELEHSGDLIDDLRTLQERTLKILDIAEGRRDVKTFLGAIAQVRGNIELLAKMTIAAAEFRRQEEDRERADLSCLSDEDIEAEMVAALQEEGYTVIPPRHRQVLEARTDFETVDLPAAAVEEAELDFSWLDDPGPIESRPPVGETAPDYSDSMHEASRQDPKEPSEDSPFVPTTPRRTIAGEYLSSRSW